MKILIVDDHPLIREAMRSVLKQLDDAIQVLEAGTCEEALTAASREPDLALILLDLRLPGTSGLDGLQVLRERYPNVPVVVLSASEDRGEVMRALDLGAMGFIPKTQPSGVMIGALKVVLSGGVYLPADVMSQAEAAPAAQPQEDEGVYDPKTQGAELGLTPRQAEVLSLLIQGKPNKLICRELNLAEGTVKIHVAAILKALGVMNRTQAVVAVSRMGLKLGPLRPRPGTQPPGGPNGGSPSSARAVRQ
ncbi:MAG TPA: response regulator transcription factor [Burkholderiales bacterium]|nr:response regulator transcription factor [Burkholderiales bacterium]